MSSTCGAGTTYPFGAHNIALFFFLCLKGVRIVHVVKLHVFTVLVSCCDGSYVLARFPYQMMFLSFNSNTTRVTRGAGTAHSQIWWVLCLFAYLRWWRRDVCNFHIIYINDIIHNCICVIFWTWKWYIESSWIKWNEN